MVSFVALVDSYDRSDWRVYTSTYFLTFALHFPWPSLPSPYPYSDPSSFFSLSPGPYLSLLYLHLTLLFISFIVLLGQKILSTFSGGSDLYAFVVGLYVIVVSLSGINRFGHFIADVLRSQRQRQATLIETMASLLRVFSKARLSPFPYSLP